MSVEVLDALPSEFHAGDTVSWTRGGGDYPPGDGWTLHYAFLNGSHRYAIDATTSGLDYAVTLTNAKTKDWAPGLYTVIPYVTSDTEQVTLDSLLTNVLPNPAKAPNKSVARQTLEAMEEALRKLAGGSNATFSANGQSFSKKNLKDLQDAIGRQRDLVRREESLSSTTWPARSIHVRFSKGPVLCDDD